MTFILSSNTNHDKMDIVESREQNLRTLLVKTMSWRGFKRPDINDDKSKKNDPPEVISDNKIVPRESSMEQSRQSVHGMTLFTKKSNDSYHSISSEESFAEEGDECVVEWPGDGFPHEHNIIKQFVHGDHDDDYDDDEEGSILLHEEHNEKNEQDDTLQSSWESSHRHATNRRRRRHNKLRNNSSNSGLDFGFSLGSLNTLSSYDETLENVSDSLDIGSRHSVGRSNRRRTTHNRHLHHLPRQKQQHSVSTSSDPLSNYSCTSILHKRLESNLQAQSQHSVMSRENPRYVVVKADPVGSDYHKARSSHGVIPESQKKEPSTRTTTTTSIEHPRFIVVNAKPKDCEEKEEKQQQQQQQSRRGRRRRIHSVEKTTQSC